MREKYIASTYASGEEISSRAISDFDGYEGLSCDRAYRRRKSDLRPAPARRAEAKRAVEKVARAQVTVEQVAEDWLADFEK